MTPHVVTIEGTMAWAGSAQDVTVPDLVLYREHDAVPVTTRVAQRVRWVHYDEACRFDERRIIAEDLVICVRVRNTGFSVSERLRIDGE